MAKAIKVENLSKAYQLGQFGTNTISGDAQRWWTTKILGKEDPFLKIGESNDHIVKGESKITWSLKDINFEVYQGEALGIIGQNGAGKSTLLKILSRITSPTKGGFKIKGRMASLLEVGTGFHPELSGRENIFLNGAILGMRKWEIQKQLDEIVDFAGIDRYLDTPVKRYSSGMYVRLAFAVAAHLDAEILVVDEVLAVGDFEFQKKCLGKMKDVSKKEGRTVLFVSHQMDAITRLCSRVLLLSNGELTFNGDPSTAIKKYLGKNENENGASVNFDVQKKNPFTNLRSIRLKSNSKILGSSADVRDIITVEVIFEVFQENLSASPGINVYNEFGDHLFTSHHVDYMVNPTLLQKGMYKTEVIIPSNFFAEGVIFFSVALIQYTPFTIFENEEKILSLTITDTVDGTSARGIYGGYFPGLVRPKLNWSKIHLTK